MSRQMAAMSAGETDCRARAVARVVEEIAAHRLPADPAILTPLACLSRSAAIWAARTVEFLEAA